MSNILLNHSMECAERRKLLFNGDLLLYSANENTIALTAHAISMIQEALNSLEPQKAQFSVSVEDFIARVGPLKTRFTNDLETKKLVRNILKGFCCDLETTYFDVPRLRVVPHGGYLSSGVSYAYKAHRDIWYSSPVSQVNWWMPVYPVTAQRAMSLFPEYWDKPLLNSSEEFDYAEWCANGRKMATNQIKNDVRKHPLPKETVSTVSELRIAGNTGDVLLFSASHLHSTAENTSGCTRFSIDFRTINIKDIESGNGAPAIDNKSKGSTLGDFLRASDFQHLELR